MAVLGAEPPSSQTRQSVAVRVVDEDTLKVTIAPPLDDGGANITHYNIGYTYCLKIVTFSSGAAAGTLNVYVHDGLRWNTEATGSFALSQVVLEKCFSMPFVGLEIKNPTNSGWNGEIMIQNQRSDCRPRSRHERFHFFAIYRIKSLRQSHH